MRWARHVDDGRIMGSHRSESLVGRQDSAAAAPGFCERRKARVNMESEPVILGEAGLCLCIDTKK